MNDVREQLKYVVENSVYVKINYTKLDNFINSLGKPNYRHWYNFTSLNLNEKEKIILAFIIESLNFCFWQKPKFKIEYKGNIIKGSEALFYSIIREVESNKDFLDIEFLNKLTKDDFENIGFIISRALKNSSDEKVLKELEEEVLNITSKYPLWY